MADDTCEYSLSSFRWTVVLFLLLWVTCCIVTEILLKRYVPKAIYIATTEQFLAKICRIILEESVDFKAIGFDAEWVTSPGGRNPISLLQICSPKGTCALIRLNKLKRVPKCLLDILEDRKIVKVGIAPEGDSLLLTNDYGARISCTLDIRSLYLRNDGLAKMSSNILGVTLDKHYLIRCSDWEANLLTDRQIMYAAMDAYVAIEIFKKWAGFGRYSLQWSLGGWKEIYESIESFCDTRFQATSSKSSKKIMNQILEKEKYNLKLKKGKILTLKKAIYDNCLMQAPDGTLLCTIRKSKAKWYLSSKRAVRISKEPLTIRLLFEPKKKVGADENLYEKELKCNQCVVCGNKKKLVRHWIVPHMYSKHFPLELKSHHSHDILLFCVNCHLISQRSFIGHHIDKLAGVTPFKRGHLSSPVKYLKTLQTVKNIPEQRRMEMEKKVKEVYQLESITEDTLRELLQRKEPPLNYKEYSPGKSTVEYFQQDGRTIFDLQKICREDFLKTMQPKFLPKYWSVDRRD